MKRRLKKHAAIRKHLVQTCSASVHYFPIINALKKEFDNNNQA